MRDGVSIQLTSFEEKTLARVEAKYALLERKLPTSFRFRIETIDEKITWIGRGNREEEISNQ